MKKGVGCLVLGLILIFVQILSVIGNANAGIKINLSFNNFSVFIFDLLRLFGYFLIGIIGLILFFSGLYSYLKKPKQTNEEMKEISIEPIQRSASDDTPIQEHNTKQSPQEISTVEGDYKEESPLQKNIQVSKEGKFNIYKITTFILFFLLVILLICYISQGQQLSRMKNNQSTGDKTISQKEEPSTSPHPTKDYISTPLPTKDPIIEDVSDQISKIDKNLLPNLGVFPSVRGLRNQLKRNLENPRFVLVSIEGLVVRNDQNSNLYVVDVPSLQGVVWLYALKHQIANELLEEAEDFIKINMKNDTTNRVITGDYIKLSGILDTINFQLYEAEYEMIKPFE